MTPKQIARRRRTIEKRMQVANQALQQLQIECSHENAVYELCGSSGNWDRDEYYWANWYCSYCGNRWNTDQSWSSLNENIPSAKRVKRIDYSEKA